jgi:hypothetical protein
MRNRIRGVFGIFVLVATLMGCGDEATCITDTTSLVKINFVDSLGTSKDINLNRVTTITDPDIYPQYDGDTLSSLVLAMNPARQNTTVIFETTTGNDTVDLSYKVTAIFISDECGIDLAFSDLDTLSTTFDQLEIIESIFHENITVNIEIRH